MLKKMIGRILLSVVMMFTILFQGNHLNVIAEGSGREVASKITAFRILDNTKKVVDTILYTEDFYLAMDWDASENGKNLQGGDYFDISLPDQMKFSLDPSKTDFNIVGADGTTVIAKAHVIPGTGNQGGKIRVTFTSWVVNRENVKGNFYLAAKFVEADIRKNQENTFSITVNGRITPVKIKVTDKPAVNNDEIIAKGPDYSVKNTGQAIWTVRVNFAKAQLSNVVLTDSLRGGNGTETSW